MKKFFKALAVVLALTLVIGTIPASAAVNLSLIRDSKIIYIGGAQGTNAEGVKCKTSKMYKLSKLVKGFDAETMDIELETADAKIAKVNNETDRVYAKSIGKTVVTIYVKDIDTKDILATFEVPVQVKKNAGEVTIKSDEIADGAKVGVNTEYTVVLPRKDADGKFVDTDARNLTCEDSSVDITKTAQTTFTVKFTKPGEFTLKASAFQSKKFDTPIVEKEIKVTAALKAESVKQTALNKAAVTFDCVVSGLKPENFSAYYMINGVEIPFSSVKNVDCKEDVATVEFYTSFVADGATEYFVKYNDQLAGSFVAAKVTADSVATVSIPDQKIVANETSKLNYALLDENGIDITSLVGTTLTGTVSFSFVEAATNAFVSGDQVYIQNVGESYTVKGVYTYFPEGKEKSITGEGKVTSIAAPVKTCTGVIGGVYELGTDDITTDGNKAKAVANFTMSEAASKAAIQICVNYMTGDKASKESLANGYILKVADESVVMLSEEASKSYEKALIANKAGSTTILVYDAEGKNVLGAIPVTVLAARQSNTFSVVANKNNINMGYAPDTIEFKFTLKDQYGDDMKGKEVKISQVSGEKNAKVLSNSTFEDKATLGTKAITLGENKGGAVTLKFECDGKSQTYMINVVEDTKIANQSLKVSGTELDTAIKADTEAKSVKVELIGATANNYAATGAAITFAAERPESKIATAGVTETKYVYTVVKDGTLLTAPNDNFKNDTFTNIVKKADGTASKLAAGNYVITAYEVNIANGVQTVKALTPATLIVKDSQAQVEFTKEVEKASTVNGAFKFKFNGADVTSDVTEFDYTESATTWYVKSAKYTINNAALGSFTLSVSINALINK